MRFPRKIYQVGDFIFSGFFMAGNCVAIPAGITAVAEFPKVFWVWVFVLGYFTGWASFIALVLSVHAVLNRIYKS